MIAIKTIIKKEINEMGLQNRIYNEIEIHLKLNHPNILNLYGWFEDSENIYLLLELMIHENLYKTIKKGISNELKNNYIAQLLTGISYLRKNKIIHRDLKPENILISYNILKICDFGWATYSFDLKKSFCGTIDYISPLIIEGTGYDNSVDLWSLGIIIYEIYAGITPFLSNSFTETLSKIIEVTN